MDMYIDLKKKMVSDLDGLYITINQLYIVISQPNGLEKPMVGFLYLCRKPFVAILL